MKLWQTLLPTLLLVVLLIAGGCAAESQTEPAPAPPIDLPRLSSQEAISVAQQHSVMSPLNIYEKRVGIWYADSTQGWIADYAGNGKWTVELRLSNEVEYWKFGGLTIHRWSVFETNLTAVYLGAYKGN